jgi:hypothetical protein
VAVATRKLSPHTGAGYKKRFDKLSPHTGAGYKKRFENGSRFRPGAFLQEDRQMEHNPGFVYHIKDSYFDVAQDQKLMRNHEGEALRPTFLSAG